MSAPDTAATPLMWASRVLDEAVMGFLALVALATAIGPLVFDVSPATDYWLTVVEWTVLALFVVEFAVQWAATADRSAWLRSPWRIVDALCILGPLLSLLPQVSDTLRGALVLRFLRVGRAVAFGARASVLAVQRKGESRTARHRGRAEVTVVRPGLEGSPADSTWEAVLEWTRQPTVAWYHASGVSREQFMQLVRPGSVSDQDVAHFFDYESQPRIRSEQGLTSISLWLPTAQESGFPKVSRNRLLALFSDTGLLTATWSPFELPGKLTSSTAPHAALVNISFPLRMTAGLLAFVGDRYTVVAHRQEEELHRLEQVRVNEGGAHFLNHAFLLQREIAGAASDVWRLKGILQTLTEKELAGVGTQKESFLGNLQEETEGLFQRLGELKEAVKSLMELHMNVTSFEMNKFMKLLAVVGFLGLIPSVAGGLLGMNVIGNPWSVTIGQVAFCIVMAMAVSLYVFAIKGWLR